MKFNRYWISDRSGLGVGKWQYFTGDFLGDKYEAQHEILEFYESWAQWAESYSLEIELDVTPTKQFVQSEIQETAERIVQLNAKLNELLDINRELKDDE